MNCKKISILNISLTNGGAEKVISVLLKRLIIDYDVTFIMLYNDIHFEIPQEVETIILCRNSPRNRSTFLKLFDPFRFVIKYNRILRERDIKQAVSFLAYPNLINGIISIFNPSIKTYISERGFPSNNVTSKLSFIISKIFYPLLYNRCYKLFSNSIYINKDLRENFNVKIPMEVIYNPIELPDFPIDPLSLGENKQEFKIINVGTLNVRKNQNMILKAIKNLNFNCQLTLLGGGPLEKELKNQVLEYNLTDKVIFGGVVSNVTDDLIDNCCFVLSSFTEGFPNALLEAMSVGLPCISTNCLSGPLELLHGNEQIEIPQHGFFNAKYGILINNDDEIGLAEALKYLHNNPNERIRYSTQSLKRAKLYELDIIYGEFKNFITF